MKKLVSLFVVLAMLCTMLAAIPAFADEYTIPYVTEGLEALYEGTRNLRAGHDPESDAWEDLSGHGLDIEDIDLEKYQWVEDGLKISAAKILLPEELADIINTGEYTVEYFIKDLTVTGNNFATFINSANDNFALFIRNSDGNIEFKNASNARTKAPKGVELVNGHTLAVTHKTGDKIQVAIDGKVVATQEAKVDTNANTPLFIGHNDPNKSYDATIVSLRFYSRVLSEEELTKNASVISHEQAEIKEYDYTVKGSSFDTLIVNDVMNFNEPSENGMIDGEASKKLDLHNRTVDGSDGSVTSLLVRGWIGFDKEIEQFGIKIGDQITYSDEYRAQTGQDVLNAGGQYASRWQVSIDPSTLTGTNRIVVVVKLVNGIVVELDGQEHENGAGRTVNTSFTYIAASAGEDPGENPGGTEDPGTVVPPSTGDATVSIFAIVVVLALCAALVMMKKRVF
ncbi:MAG: LamG domain-containing protein [Clostridia bacterium]|nr:LamG domain-containing protein [Clostridia bacterium]